MQKSPICAALWQIGLSAWGNVRVQTHYQHELSSAGEPLYYWRHEKRGNISE